MKRYLAGEKQQNIRLHFIFYLIVTQKQYAVLKAIRSIYEPTELWYLKVFFHMLPKLESFFKTKLSGNLKKRLVIFFILKYEQQN
jgi:hypothetical protein